MNSKVSGVDSVSKQTLGLPTPPAHAPLGVFDSGVGGLTVARAIGDLLPREEIYYLGDTANSPYGSRPLAEVRKLALKALDSLVDRGVKVLVIACNTASAAMLQDARERYQKGAGIPVVEVIRPAVRKAVNTTRNGRIGVIGTVATISSHAYRDAFTAAPHLQIFEQACPAFAGLVERGLTHGPQVQAAVEEYLTPVKEAQIDTLILGCTHYPLLAGPISHLMGPEVSLVSSASETARDVYRVLVEEQLVRPDCVPPPQHQFLDTGNSEPFAEFAQRIMGGLVGKSAAEQGFHTTPTSAQSPDQSTQLAGRDPYHRGDAAL